MAVMDRAAAIARWLEKARAKQRPLGIICHFNSPSSVEALGRLGAEWIVLDQEHTAMTGETLTTLIRTAELHDCVSVVRLHRPDPFLARQAFDAGACAVWAPFVDNPTQLRSLVEGSKYPPRGDRGYCTLPRVNANGVGDALELIRFSSEHPIVIPGINSEEALENLDELLSIPECPIYVIGSVDLGVRTGLADYDELHKAIKLMKAIAKKVHEAGKLVMDPLLRPGSSLDEAVSICEEVGIDLPYTSEANCLAAGFRENQSVTQALARHAAGGVSSERPVAQEEKKNSPPSC